MNTVDMLKILDDNKVKHEHPDEYRLVIIENGERYTWDINEQVGWLSLTDGVDTNIDNEEINSDDENYSKSKALKLLLNLTNNGNIPNFVQHYTNQDDDTLYIGIKVTIPMLAVAYINEYTKVFAKSLKALQRRFV